MTYFNAEKRSNAFFVYFIGNKDSKKKLHETILTLLQQTNILSTIKKSSEFIVQLTNQLYCISNQDLKFTPNHIFNKLSVTAKSFQFMTRKFSVVLFVHWSLGNTQRLS